MKHCTIIFLSFLIASSLAANCYGPASRLTVVEFAAFPSPVAAGEEIHIRANLQPDHVITAAQVQISVYYARDNQEETLVVSLPSLDLCTLSSKISCPLQPTQNILAWDFPVPDILPGNYLVKYTILESNPPADVNPYSCIQFNIVVSGVQANTFNSWYQATLLGTAIFTNPNYTQRQLGHEVQVGLGGNLDFNAPPYGMIKGLSGSGDLVPNPFYDTSSFVWGLSGTLEKVAYGPNGLIIHTYTGACYLGYINGAFNYDHENPLIEGTFHLNWTYKDSSTAQINGYANFEPATGTIPVGWGYPLLYGRLGRHEIVTSDVGFFMIKGSTPFCAVPGDCKSTNPDIGRPDDDNGLSSDMLGVAIGVPIAAVFIALLIAAALLFFKRRRETEQEDGVFAVARKPEYGSALVVDDIIEETRGSKTLQAMIDIKDEYSDDGSDDDSASQTSRSSRSRSRTPLSGSVSRSVSRSHSRHVRSGDDSDPGESASRGSDSD